MTLRFAILGTGFWARYQLAGWRELEGVECVALYNRTRARAEVLAHEFGVPAVYDDAGELLRREAVDFVDVITHVDAHSEFVRLAAAHSVPVICQKPMAPDLATARQMVEACEAAGVPFLVHENWRWQYPIRQLKKALEEGGAGPPFRAHVLYASSFPVFDNQPFLKEEEQFILADMGSHILDVARFLFGEARSLYCQTRRVNPGIRGEDVATVTMEMGDGVTVVCSLSYASRFEHERFPETYVFVECERGAVELGPDFWIRVTTKDGTVSRRHAPPRYAWADPSHDVVHSSIVACNADLLRALRGVGPAETTGVDNFETVRLVFGAYESARERRVVSLTDYEEVTS
jgi:predicted dehydrogenase